MKTILSTKKLSNNLKKLLQDKYKIIEHDFITTYPIIWNSNTIEKNVIITSKNAIDAIKKFDKSQYKIFCVGNQTKSTLISNGFEVVESANNASNLADIIISKYSKNKFIYFCSSIRRDILPQKLSKNTIKFQEIKVYETIFTSVEIFEKVDAIMFYSPSGIKSYLQKNKITNEMCFCIGKTTAQELNLITKNIKIVHKSSIELMVLEVLNWQL